MTLYRLAYELQDTILRGIWPTEADLRSFLDAPKPVSAEGQHHDYKHADILTDQRKGADVLRQYASAFANAEGGVLIVGVDNSPTRAWTPIEDKKFGASGVKEWAEKCLNDLASAHGLTYRVATVAVEGGLVLLVAAARGLTLVPLFDGQRPRYFFRFGHENRAVPDFLISDLALGRRRTPTLLVEAGWCANIVEHTSYNDENHERTSQAILIGGPVTIVNNSLITAKEIVVGILTFSAKERASTPEQAIPPDLLARVDIVDHPAISAHPYALHHGRFFFRNSPAERKQASLTMKPFDIDSGHLGWQWRLETRPGLKAEAISALYVVPEGCEPLWFEVRTPLYQRVLRQNDPLGVQFVRVHGRPRIGTAVQLGATS